MKIHPTALIDPQASIGEDCLIGPYAVIEADAVIGPRCEIGPHAVVRSFVRMGEGNRVHPHATIGDVPQDLSFRGMETWVEIGDRNVFREGCTVHRSTDPQQPTRVGSECLLMANAHLAHDCLIRNRVVLANNVAVGGHVEMEDGVIVGGGVVVHQFCRIGSLAIVAGFVAVRQDVLPYTMLAGNPVCHYRLNTLGLHRSEVRGERYRALEADFRALRSGREPEGEAKTPETLHFRDWRSAPTRRGVYRFFTPFAGKVIDAELSFGNGSLRKEEAVSM